MLPLFAQKYIMLFDGMFENLYQWFSTFSLKGAKSRLTTLLESRTKEILAQVKRFVL